MTMPDKQSPQKDDPKNAPESGDKAPRTPQQDRKSS